MKSFTTRRFWKAYEKLDETTKRQAREAYKLFEKDPTHPSLFFKERLKLLAELRAPASRRLFPQPLGVFDGGMFVDPGRKTRPESPMSKAPGLC